MSSEEVVVATVVAGEYAEGDPWEIVRDHVVTVGYESADGKSSSRVLPLCPHAISVEPERFDRSTRELRARIPVAVRAHNEGGCNSTLVCLDCILQEAAKVRAAEGS